MIRFSRYEIRTEPESAPLIIYATNFVEVRNSPAYDLMRAESHPRSVQVMEQKYAVPMDGDERYATEKEIEQWKDSPDIVHVGSDIFYQYYGDMEVLTPMYVRLSEEYQKYLSECENLHEQDVTKFYEELENICSVETVYENLLTGGHCYPIEYMIALMESENPLIKLAQGYKEHCGFDIDTDTHFTLIKAREEIMEGQKENLRNPNASEGQSDDDRMQVLGEALDKEFAEYEKEWNGMDFWEKIDKHMELFTVRQFYQNMKERMHEFSASGVYCLGAFEKPLSYDMERVVTERSARGTREKEMSAVFKKMYPEIEVEPDKWEIWTIRQNTGFTLKAGKELEYQDIKDINMANVFGVGIFDYQERWAALMEQKMANGASVSEVAEQTSTIADKNGITGSMYGCAVANLSEFWEHGEELRIWHNSQYSYTGSGIVNPAVLRFEPNATEGEEIEDVAPQMSM